MKQPVRFEPGNFLSLYNSLTHRVLATKLKYLVVDRYWENWGIHLGKFIKRHEYFKKYLKSNFVTWKSVKLKQFGLQFFQETNFIGLSLYDVNRGNIMVSFKISFQLFHNVLLLRQSTNKWIIISSFWIPKE